MARERSTSRGIGPFRCGGERENDRLVRTGGASRRGEGDRDCGDRLRETNSASTSPGSGDGSRTADWTADAMISSRISEMSSVIDLSPLLQAM